MALKIESYKTDHSTGSTDFSPKFLETLINLNPDILYIFDLNEMKNIYSNDGVQKVLGYSVEEIQDMGNRLIRILMHPDDFKIYEEQTFPGYASLKDGEAIVHQYRMKHKDGTWHYLEANEVIYARNPDSSPSQIFGVIHDITQQELMISELNNAKEYIENIINTTSTIVVGLDIDGNITIFNDAACRITGYSKNDLKGKNWFEVLVPQDRYPEVWEEFKRLTSSGPPQKFENPILTKSGEECIIAWQNSVVYKDGSPVETISFGLDITERRKAEETAREANRFNEHIIASAHEGIIVYDMDLRYKVWNPCMEEISGIKASDVIGKHPTELFPALRESGILRVLERALNGEFPAPVEFSYTTNGKTVWVIDTTAPLRNTLGAVIGVIATVQDITERRRVKQELLASEEKYRALFSTMTQGVVYQDPDGRIISANRAAEEILGLTLDQLQGRTSMDPRWKAIHPDGSDFPGEEHPISIALKTGKEVKNVVHGVYHPQKDAYVWIRVSAVPLFRAGESTPYQAYAIIEDITEQRTSEEKYTMLFREMLDGFALHEIICDADNNPVDYRFLDVNPSFERMTGLRREDIAGKTVLEAMPGTEKYWIEKYGKVALTGEPDSFENYASEIGKYFEVTAFRPAPNQFACIFSDITQRRKTEELLKNTQKLESLGILAGGIAHDFNNLLGGIYGYIDLASDSSTDENIAPYLEKSLQTIDRARDLTQQLLTFAKGGEPIRKVESLFPFISDIAQFALSGSNVSIEFDIADDLRNCNFDKNQIGQVIDNIIINAQQAMPVGGTITLKAENIVLHKKEHPLLDEGTYCRISIKDSGIGIPREYMAKIFDPFFTTKTKGHGLGLSTCYSIIARHGGCIDVESTPGKGTTFQISLPATDETPASGNERANNTHQGSGTFIVMDDEEVIRDTISQMLQSFGYSVTTCENGSEVVQLISASGQTANKPAGLILDLTIPGGMGGKETIAAIRDIDKNVPVFVVSGYAKDPIIANPTVYGFTASICKPFRRAELSSLLNKYIV